MNYKGAHSLIFTSVNELANPYSQHMPGVTTYNTWTHFNLIPTGRPIFNLPEVKSEYVEIPQRDGFIDLTTKLGYPNTPRYGTRKGTWEFWVPPFLSEYPNDFQRLANAVHGLTKKVIAEDDPYYYYTGRITVDDWVPANDGSGTTVTLGYNLQPFKTAIYGFNEQQRWDPFCFRTDYFMTNGGANAYTNVECTNGNHVYFYLPSIAGNVVRSNSTAGDPPYLEPGENRIFSGMVQTSFKISVKPSVTLSTSNPGRIEIQFRNEEIHNSPLIYIYTLKSSSLAYFEEPSFLLSHRDLRNRIWIKIQPNFDCKIGLLAYSRSL